MKLAPLLASYLYEQKKLSLSGIGTFTLDPSAKIHSDEHHASEGIDFTYNSSIKEDPELIAFISKETGKMKTLASADLNSYLELACQFLNIGKPFQIEGIGTLVKQKNTQLGFTADHILFDKVKETGIKELSVTSTSDGLLTTYETLKPKSEKSPASKRIFLITLAAVTILLIVWISYKTNSPKSNNKQRATEESAPVDDTTKYVSPAATDTVSNSKPSLTSTINKGSYRFVIEVANKKRAFYRYAMLKNGDAHIQMSTTDSITFKLYFVLAATITDTARIADSLTVRYPAINHKRTFAEQ